MSRNLLIVFVTALAVAGCALASQSASPSPSAARPGEPSPLNGPFSSQTVEQAVQILSAGGVPVRVGPDDAPLAAVTNPSRVQLLRWQVRNAALEASAGAGTLGADLDDFALAAGAPPLSALVAGWLHTADSAGAAQARLLLPGYAAAEPQQLVISNLVVLLLVSDLVGSAPDRSVGSIAGQVTAGGASVAVESDFCGRVAAYLNGALAGILDPALRPEPEWLADAIALYAAIEADTDRLRAAIGALALLAYATSISQPWVATLSAAPPEAHYLVDGNELAGGKKQVIFNVDVGDGPITDEAAGCAELAGADLDGSGEPAETQVGWLTYQLAVRAVDLEGDLVLEENGEVATARLEYQTRDETEDAHSQGTLKTELVHVGATAVRQDIEAVEAAVSSLLTAGDTGAASIEVAAQYSRIKPVLLERLHPSAATVISISWHEGPTKTPSPSPSPSPEPTDDEFCVRYRALLEWGRPFVDTEFELTQPWAAEIARRMQDMRPYAPDHLIDDVDLYIRVYGTYASAPEPINVPIVGPDAVGIADATVAMSAYCGITF